MLGSLVMKGPALSIAVCAAVILALPAAAEVRLKTAKVDADVWAGVGVGDGDADLVRVTVRPSFRAALGNRFEAEAKIRAEFADDDTGLGTIETYSDASRPLRVGDSARIAIDKATVSYRHRSTRITLGKQTVAWGVLDGLQVTDRFDAVSRRDAVFSETRPERISRWGARSRFELSDTRFDVAVMADGTVGQFANPDDTYAPLAPRLRGGAPADVTVADVQVQRPNTLTAGLRVSRNIGASDMSVLVLHGPETEPLMLQSGRGGVVLTYPDRTLVGAAWERASGSKVWRVEAAYIPDQPVNTQAVAGLAAATETRFLAGAAMDWRAPNGMFLNAQIGVDTITQSGRPIVRPQTDVISTLRVQKALSNDTVTLSGEIIASLTDGDGALRPQISWQIDDGLNVSAGADIVFGEKDGLFGQYRDSSRVWIRTRRSWG